MLKIVAVMSANIARINGKVHRSRSYVPIAVRFAPTRVRLEVTALTCGPIVATGEVTCATIIKTEGRLAEINITPRTR
jgi:hypothetical protein